MLDRNYKAIADMVAKHTIEHASDTRAELVKSNFVNDMAEYFAGEPLFDRGRFLSACDADADADADDMLCDNCGGANNVKTFTVDQDENQINACQNCVDEIIGPPMADADAGPEQKALRQTTVTRQVCSCCTTEIKTGDAILFAGSLKLCSVCVARIGGRTNTVVGVCPSCGRKQKDNYPIWFSVLSIKVKPNQLTIKVPAYCEGCGFSWYAVYYHDEIIER